MKLVGFETRAVCSRYDIVGESGPVEAAERLAVLYAAPVGRKIVPMARKKRTVRHEVGAGARPLPDDDSGATVRETGS